MKCARAATLLLLCLPLLAADAPPGSLAGVRGATNGGSWSSAWIDLSTVTHFKKGDRLRLDVGGPARKIAIRLLPRGVDPSQPVWLVTRSVVLPKSGLVDVTLDQDRSDITQISVHGSAKAWTIDLGAGNGPVTELRSVVRVIP